MKLKAKTRGTDSSGLMVSNKTRRKETMTEKYYYYQTLPLEEKIRLLDEAQSILHEEKESIEESLHGIEVTLRDLDRMYGTSMLTRAESYWLSHIKEALGNGSSSICSLDDTLKEVRKLHSSEMSKVRW